MCPLHDPKCHLNQSHSAPTIPSIRISSIIISIIGA